MNIILGSQHKWLTISGNAYNMIQVIGHVFCARACRATLTAAAASRPRAPDTRFTSAVSGALELRSSPGNSPPLGPGTVSVQWPESSVTIVISTVSETRRMASGSWRSREGCMCWRSWARTSSGCHGGGALAGLKGCRSRRSRSRSRSRCRSRNSSSG